MLRLEPGPRAGPWRTAVLCEIRRSVRGRGADVSGWGAKAPVAILICGAAGPVACDPAGHVLDLEVLERLCPGLRRDLAALR